MPIRPACAAALAALVSLVSPARAAGVAAPVKKAGKAAPKPADAPAAVDASKGGEAAKEAHAEVVADPPLLHVGDDAPVFNGLLHNAKEAGVEHVDLASLVGGEGKTCSTRSSPASR